VLAAKQDELSNGDKGDLRIPEGGTPGYAVFSLKTGYKRTKNELLLMTFENMFDKKYKTHGSGVYGPGRSYVLSYSIKFD
jgi:outer membrane receptor protein involved in Fe transport